MFALLNVETLCFLHGRWTEPENVLLLLGTVQQILMFYRRN